MTWKPMTRRDNHPGFVRNPDLEELRAQNGVRPTDEIWMNDTYEASVRLMFPEGMDEPPPGRIGMIHISIHRHDREPIREWRHMQQIKNEIAGTDRWCMEIYPPEKYLVDTSNEYHLWVMPEGADMPFAFHEGLVTNDEQVARYNRKRNESQGFKGKQRPWQPGLTTGRNDETVEIDDEQARLFGQMAPDE